MRVVLREEICAVEIYLALVIEMNRVFLRFGSDFLVMRKMCFSFKLGFLFKYKFDEFYINKTILVIIAGIWFVKLISLSSLQRVYKHLFRWGLIIQIGGRQRKLRNFKIKLSRVRIPFGLARVSAKNLIPLRPFNFSFRHLTTINTHSRRQLNSASYFSPFAHLNKLYGGKGE